MELDFVINEIIKLSKMVLTRAEIYRVEKSNPYSFNNHIAFETAFGWSEIDCKDCDRNIIYGEDNPYLKKYSKNYYDKEIRCYACDQSRYIDILDALIDDDDWFVEGFNSIMDTRNQLTADVMLFYDKPTYHLQKYQWMNTTMYFQNYRSLTDCFYNFLSAYVGYSLGDFLSQAERNWKRIKKCAVCGVYFVSEKADKRLIKCSLCRNKKAMSREEYNSYHREYRERKRKRKENIIRGKELRRLMNAGYSQEDALEMYKADIQRIWDDNKTS